MLSSLLPLNERGYLLNMSRLTDALDERFTDIDEVKDIVQYGMSQGISDFIYYGDVRRFFFEHEDDIESYIEDNYGYEMFIETKQPYSVNNLINNSVWLAVELYCSHKYDVHLGGFEHDEEFHPVTA